jgi:hypothetical protein
MRGWVTVSAILRRPAITLFAIVVAVPVSSAFGVQQTPAPAAGSESLPARGVSGGGQHDFDFNFGVWKTHVSRLLDPFGGRNRVEYDGTSVVSKVWGGRASLFELEVDGPAGHIEGVGLRLYNPQSGQWNLHWTSSRDGQPQPTMYGRFVGGEGEFFDHEVVDGHNVLVRNTFSDIKPDSARFEQAYSTDGGRSWEANWIMTFARASDREAAVRTAGAAQHEPQEPAASGDAGTDGAAVEPGQHDFDFAFGTWRTHVRRLKDPLSGSNDWVEYDGTHTIRKVWNGRANLGELEADGPAGHIEAVSPRYFDPQTHLWRVSYGSPRDGSLTSPLVGQFKNGLGEFYGQETYKGREILVREIYSPIDASTRRLAVAYSADGGRSWETNWIMTDTRVSGP